MKRIADSVEKRDRAVDGREHSDFVVRVMNESFQQLRDGTRMMRFVNTLKRLFHPVPMLLASSRHRPQTR